MSKRVIILEKQKKGIAIHLIATDEALAKDIKAVITSTKGIKKVIPTLVLNNKDAPKPLPLDDVVFVLDEDETENAFYLQGKLIILEEDASDPKQIYTQQNAFVQAVDLKDTLRSIHILAGISWKQDYNYRKKELIESMKKELPDVTIPLEELYKMEPDELGSIVYQPAEGVVEAIKIAKAMKDGFNPEDMIEELFDELLKSVVDPTKDTTKH